MPTAAILPVKRFTRAKQRLGATVADPLRLDLARAMVGDVLSALRESTAIHRTIVVTGEPPVAAAAAYQGSLVVDDATDDGQSAAVASGIELALAESFERVLCIPGDCPALDPAEIDRLLLAPTGLSAEIVIIPDRHTTGTNGLLLTPPDAIAPSFGPDSCARHRRLAAEAGIPCRVEHLPSLLLDIDTGEDLAVLRERLAAGPAGRARRTRTVLRAALAIDDPLRSSDRPAPRAA